MDDKDVSELYLCGFEWDKENKGTRINISEDGLVATGGEGWVRGTLLVSPGQVVQWKVSIPVLESQKVYKVGAINQTFNDWDYSHTTAQGLWYLQSDGAFSETNQVGSFHEHDNLPPGKECVVEIDRRDEKKHYLNVYVEGKKMSGMDCLPLLGSLWPCGAVLDPPSQIMELVQTIVSVKPAKKG
mmetsp:Transcript_10866/g.14540  ORF Transcript_10866/g.14540 Transcript_10866/m.14540 type:complete len:185 (-) Transcript_10866:171-725(-)|eukprot:CAMPEP_0201481356 /NCGR_PEP_ID=MMETSP0151_2-20130828/5631_1 /ASSEMBLY_ACC=CAM_ASM_000257 /TAXON_ID=200890 /ORGANISM="Paramoeba atlantica, Strain 621/1 / CCAP 1560/9" /LENGTH=184 /DNA_ID=CAMNT_0047863509 /DNA_START=51 /DNA_END=605 /DNA_ORIENTATION=-